MEDLRESDPDLHEKLLLETDKTTATIEAAMLRGVVKEKSRNGKLRVSPTEPTVTRNIWMTMDPPLMTILTLKNSFAMNYKPH